MSSSSKPKSKSKHPPPSRRTTPKDVDKIFKSMQTTTKLPLGYRHWDEFKYQLYLQDESGQRLIGRPSLGNGNFYDVLLAVRDILLFLQEKEGEKNVRFR